MRAADGDAAGGADVGTQPIEEDDLPIEQHHRHLGPVLGMRRPAAAAFRTVRFAAVDARGENIVAALAEPFLARGSGCHSPEPHAPPVDPAARAAFNFY